MPDIPLPNLTPAQQIAALQATANNYAAEVTRLQTELQTANSQLQSTQAALEACQTAASVPTGVPLPGREQIAAQALVGVLASIRRMPDYKSAVEYAFRVADEFIAQRARASLSVPTNNPGVQP